MIVIGIWDKINIWRFLQSLQHSPMCKFSSAPVLLCAFEVHGHVNPIMLLSEKLALLGLSVTVVIPSRSMVSLLRSRTTDALGISFHVLEVDESGAEKASLAPPAIKRVRKHQGQAVFTSWPDHSAHEQKFEHLLREMVDSGSPPAAVIYDAILTWPFVAAMNFNVAKYAFYSSSVSYLSTSFYLRKFSLSEMNGEVQVPGLPALAADDIYFSSLSVLDSSHALYYPKKAWENQLVHVNGVLLNSSVELEGKVLAALRRGDVPAARPFKDKLITIGPLLPSSSSSRCSVIPSTEEETCRSFLDQQSVRSVVYISFGSWARLYDEQVTELAAGLEAANYSFLWALPLEGTNDPDDYLQKALPRGFLDSTSARRLIVRKYVPQHLILSHPATAAFLTHCGWNSSLECIALAGVPVVTWPFLADQPFNSRLMVEELRVGVEVVDNADGIVERTEVERVLRLVMEGDEAEAMRARASLLKKLVTSALETGTELRDFVDEIKQ